jgi:hypothetical protein
MHHLLKAALLVAGLGLVAGGCSSKSSDDGAGAVPVAQADLPEQLAQVYCSKIAPCCTAAHVAYDTASCESRVQGAGVFLAASKAGQTYDAAAAGKCLSELATALSRCVPYAGDATPDCDKIVIGNTPAGGSCTISRDCVAPNLCLYLNGADVGTCGPEDPTPELGEACTVYCAADSWCSAGVCLAEYDSGPCKSGAECTTKSYCDDSVGQCVAKKADGQACVYDYQCINFGCVGGKLDTTPSADGNGTCGKAKLASEHTCSGEAE